MLGWLEGHPLWHPYQEVHRRQEEGVHRLLKHLRCTEDQRRSSERGWQTSNIDVWKRASSWERRAGRCWLSYTWVVCLQRANLFQFIKIKRAHLYNQARRRLQPHRSGYHLTHFLLLCLDVSDSFCVLIVTVIDSFVLSMCSVEMLIKIGLIVIGLLLAKFGYDKFQENRNKP